MAKLKAPLMSLGASGAIAKSIVYFPWKGLNCAREYIVPSNPKTVKQTTQRGYLSEVVDAIHAAQADVTNPLVSADVVAYSLYGSCEPTPRTWFNQAVKNWLDQKVKAKLPCLCSAGSLANTTAGQLDASIYLWEATCIDGKFYYGTSKTALINSVAATIITQTATGTIPGLTKGVKYFVQFRPAALDPCEDARSGIYTEYAT